MRIADTLSRIFRPDGLRASFMLIFIFAGVAAYFVTISAVVLPKDPFFRMSLNYVITIFLVPPISFSSSVAEIMPNVLEEASVYLETATALAYWYLLASVISFALEILFGEAMSSGIRQKKFDKGKVRA